jgi:hypothetical protein
MRLPHSGRVLLTVTVCCIAAVATVVALTAADTSGDVDPVASPSLATTTSPKAAAAQVSSDDQEIRKATDACVNAWADRIAPGAHGGLALEALRALADGHGSVEHVRSAIIDLAVTAPAEAEQFYGVADCAILVGKLWLLPAQAGGDPKTPLSQDPAAGPTSMPDLQVSLEASVTQVCIGGGTNITAVVHNNGNDDTVGYDVRWSVEGQNFDGQRPGINSTDQDRWIAYHNWTPLAAGRYLHVLTVDPGQKVAESDESNNSASITIEAVPCVEPKPQE